MVLCTSRPASQVPFLDTFEAVICCAIPQADFVVRIIDGLDMIDSLHWKTSSMGESEALTSPRSLTSPPLVAQTGVELLVTVVVTKDTGLGKCLHGARIEIHRAVVLSALHDRA